MISETISGEDVLFINEELGLTVDKSLRQEDHHDARWEAEMMTLVIHEARILQSGMIHLMRKAAIQMR